MPRISDLTSYTAPSNSDLLAIVDQAGAVTKKITRADLLKGTALPADTVTTPAITDSAVTPVKWTNPYKFHVIAGSSMSVPTTIGKLTVMTDKKFDSNNNFTSSTYTAPVDGFYQLSGGLQVLAGASGERFGATIYKNGTTPILTGANAHSSASSVVSSNASGLVQLTAGDTIELWGISSTGGRGLTSFYDATYISGFLVSQT